MTLYQIPNWESTFENNKSREIDECSFVAMPNKQHGLGLTRILARPDGASLFGIWCLILQAVSRQPRPRAGWLTDDGTPTGAEWDIEDMAMRWRRTPDEIRAALEVLCSAKIGWLKVYESAPVSVAQVSPECPSGADAVPADCPSTTLGKGKEGKEGRKEQGREAERHPDGTSRVPTPQAPPGGDSSDNPPGPGPALPARSKTPAKGDPENIDSWWMGLTESRQALIANALHIAKDSPEAWRRDLEAIRALITDHGFDQVIYHARKLVKHGAPPFVTKVREVLKARKP